MFGTKKKNKGHSQTMPLLFLIAAAVVIESVTVKMLTSDLCARGSAERNFLLTATTFERDQAPVRHKEEQIMFCVLESFNNNVWAKENHLKRVFTSTWL